MANNISPLAFVHPEAKIGQNVTIGAFVYIDANVTIGDDTVIHSHTSILNGTVIGRGNRIYEGCIIGATPQDFRWKGEASGVTIGDGNVLREQVIVNRSIHLGKSTRIGNENHIMAQVHISHDAWITNQCILGNGCQIAGDVKVSHCTVLSSNVIVYEGRHIGPWVLVKGGCRVTGNIPPYVIMAHNPIQYFGVNAVLMARGQKPQEVIDEVAKCYRHVYQSNTALFNALLRIQEDTKPGRERDSIINFIKDHDFQLAGTNIENFT